MNLIPMPQKIEVLKEIFKLKNDINIFIENFKEIDLFNSANILKEEIKNKLGLELDITKCLGSVKKVKGIFLTINKNFEEEEYIISINRDLIEISGSTEKGIFYGVITLVQIIKEYGYKIPCMSIEDKPYFKNRGFYHDVTRGKVPKLETLKKLVDKASYYKINQLQLYIEHTFAFKNMSEVWIDKDPLTAEEIIALDKYCKERYVELVPSIATFGHLYEILKLETYKDLCEIDDTSDGNFSFVERMSHHTLNVSNKKSIELVEYMINEFLPLFSSDKFNICCDETFDLGKGKSKKLADEIGIGNLYVNFLNDVISIVKKHNKQVMFWGDIIINHNELLKDIDKEVICLNWNYGHEANEIGTKIIAESKIQQYVCPGVAGWNQFMNYINNSFNNISRMIKYGVKYKAIGVLNTDWGDFGHINSMANSMPGMIYGADLSWNPNFDENFEEVFKRISKVEYQDKTESVIKTISDLDYLQDFGWRELVIWKEKFDEDIDIVIDLKERMNKADIKELVNNTNKALEIEEKLYEILGNVEDKESILTFILSSRGIAIINKVFKIIIDKTINSKVYSKEENYSLAEEFELWFYDYCKEWRKNNKESELNRIREVIQYTCNYIRNIK
jgi:hypothetical protein